MGLRFFLLLLLAIPAAADENCSDSLKVQHAIRGLYQKVPERKFYFTAQEHRFETQPFPEDSHTYYITEVRDSFGRHVGTVRTGFANDRSEMEFNAANLRYVVGLFQEVPSVMKLRGIPEMIPGRGVPTITLITLLHMKSAGIAYGGLDKAWAANVGNLQTSLELISNPKIAQWLKEHPKKTIPQRLLEEAFHETNSGRYMETVLIQSGHQIASTKISKVKILKVKDVAMDYHYDDPKLAPLLTKFSSDDLIPYDFTVEFDLVPVGPLH